MFTMVYFMFLSFKQYNENYIKKLRFGKHMTFQFLYFQHYLIIVRVIM